MKKVNIADVSVPLEQFVRELGKEPAILLHRGKPVAVIEPVWNADIETVSLSLNPKFLKMMQDSRESIIRNGGIPIEEMMQEFAAEDAKKNGPAKKANGRKKRTPAKPS